MCLKRCHFKRYRLCNDRTIFLLRRNLINRDNLDVLKQQIGLSVTRGIGCVANEDNVNAVVRKNKASDTAHIVDANRYRALVAVKQSRKRSTLTWSCYLGTQYWFILLNDSKGNATAVLKQSLFRRKRALGDGLSPPMAFLQRHRQSTVYQTVTALQQR